MQEISHVINKYKEIGQKEIVRKLPERVNFSSLCVSLNRLIRIFGMIRYEFCFGTARMIILNFDQFKEYLFKFVQLPVYAVFNFF